MRNQAEEKGETVEARAETGTGKSHCEARPGRDGKEEQRLSSQNPKLRRTKECRNSGRRKELQRAEYRNRKDGMATGRTEEEICTVGTAARGKREEGKRKSGRLSSQNRAKNGRKKV